MTINTTDLQCVPVMTCETDPHVGTHVLVTYTFPHAGVDRAAIQSISCGRDNTKARALGRRLCAAITAGVVVKDAKVLTDINGKTYVSFNSAVLGRYLNADLKRLGY